MTFRQDFLLRAWDVWCWEWKPHRWMALDVFR